MSELDARTLIASARRRESTYRLCLRGDLLAEHERLERELEAATQGGASAATLSTIAADLAADVTRVEGEIAASTVTLTFRALPRREWELLLDSHPARADRTEAFNVSTLPVALVAASLADPTMTAGEVEELFDVLNEGQRDGIFAAAWSVNTEATAVPFSERASVVTRWREQSLRPRDLGESPAASS